MFTKILICNQSYQLLLRQFKVYSFNKGETSTSRWMFRLCFIIYSSTEAGTSSGVVSAYSAGSSIGCSFSVFASSLAAFASSAALAFASFSASNLAIAFLDSFFSDLGL